MIKTKNSPVNLPLIPLTSLSPLDGRYYESIKELSFYVSEYALIKTRFELEAQYLVVLSDARIIRELTPRERKRLLTFGDEVTLSTAARVKEVESQVRHDVKSMERVFRELLASSTLVDSIEMLHFGLTSEDINNLSYRLMLRRATHDVCIPTLNHIIADLVSWAEKYKALPMLGRTHGQAAVPTTLGKEFVVFASRLYKEVKSLKEQMLTGKLTGAVGNFNALVLSYPKVDWVTFSKKFVASLGLTPNVITTQINTYEDVIAYFHIYQRIHGILLDFNQDIWRYISDNWLVQEARRGEVGSSTMPQKVNPEDFEKSEGNLIIANSLLEGMTRKLSISRLQRDLSDSTTIRNIGTVLGYSLVSYKSTLRGLSRIKANKKKILEDLNSEWSILGEGVQTVLRREKVEDPYSLISSLTRGKHVGEEEWKKWISELPIPQRVKKELFAITPLTYIGAAEQLTKNVLREIKSKK